MYVFKQKMWKIDKIEKITIKKSKYFKKYPFLVVRYLNVLLQVGALVKY